MPIVKTKTPVINDGLCENCGKKKQTRLLRNGYDWKQICEKCEAGIRPYLRETPKHGPPIKVGGIIIGYEPYKE